jgi:hypothetical protein
MKFFRNPHKKFIFIFFGLVFIGCFNIKIIQNTEYYLKEQFGTYTFLNDSIYKHNWRQGLLWGNEYGKYYERNFYLHFDPTIETFYELNRIIEEPSCDSVSTLTLYILDSIATDAWIFVYCNDIRKIYYSDYTGKIELPECADMIYVQHLGFKEFRYQIFNKNTPIHYKVYLCSIDTSILRERNTEKYKINKNKIKHSKKNTTSVHKND